MQLSKFLSQKVETGLQFLVQKGSPRTKMKSFTCKRQILGLTNASDMTACDADKPQLQRWLGFSVILLPLYTRDVPIQY